MDNNSKSSLDAARYLMWIALALVLIFFAVAFAESELKSPIADEPPHIASGLSYVATGIFRFNLQHPPLLKELSGLSLLAGGYRWPRNPETDAALHGPLAKGVQPDWLLGVKIISQDPDRVLRWARLPFLLLAALLGFMIFIFGRHLIGGLGALFAVLLYITDPNILAHSFTVTTDLGLAAFAFLLIFALWRYIQNPTIVRLLMCGLALGAALCAKFSALLLLPVVVLLLLAAVIWPVEPEGARTRTKLDPFFLEQGFVSDLIGRLRRRYKADRNDPCPCGSGKKFKACHGSTARVDSVAIFLSERWLLCAGAFLIMAVVACMVIETLYFFPSDPMLYVQGAKLVNADHNPNYLAYMANEVQRRFITYFAVAYLLKEPLAGVILAIGGLILLVRGKSITPIRKLFLLAPALVLFLGPTIWADQIGIRYIIPMLPFTHLLGGLALAKLVTNGKAWGRWAAAGLCAWLVVAVAGIYPDQISYFNESACLLTVPSRVGLDGGTKCGVLWLDDSNVDWGQGLKQVKQWWDRNAKGRTIRYGSHYVFPPDAYGMPSIRADIKELDTKPVTGLYVVSANSVARIPAHPGASDWLRRVPPVAIVGHAMYIYDIP